MAPKAGSASLSDRSVRVLRFACIVAGILLIALALAADSLGLSIGAGVSMNQIVMAAMGATLVLAGALGRRFPRFWKGLGLLLLNVVTALVLLDMVSLVLLKATGRYALPSGLPRERIEGIRRAQGASVWGSYTPYVVWKAAPLQRGAEGTDSLGNRLTTGASADPDAFEVLFMGGSAAWGSGVPDSATIPSLLQQQLARRASVPVRVVNLGQISWVTTQEIVDLSLLLRDGWAPDLVIFYDGFNDVCSAFRYGRAGLHWDYPQVRDMLNGTSISRLREEAPAMLLEETSTYQLLRRLGLAGGLSVAESPDPAAFAVGRESLLAVEVGSIYSANMRFARDLGTARAFRVCCVLQPTIWTGEKALTADESHLLAGVAGLQIGGSDSTFVHFLRTSYEDLRASSSADSLFFDMTGALDGVRPAVYIDAAGCHLNEAGNRVVAVDLADSLLDAGLVPALEGVSGK